MKIEYSHNLVFSVNIKCRISHVDGDEGSLPEGIYTITKIIPYNHEFKVKKRVERFYFPLYEYEILEPFKKKKIKKTKSKNRFELMNL